MNDQKKKHRVNALCAKCLPAPVTCLPFLTVCNKTYGQSYTMTPHMNIRNILVEKKFSYHRNRSRNTRKTITANISGEFIVMTCI